jgi:hypothetical protein
MAGGGPLVVELGEVAGGVDDLAADDREQRRGVGDLALGAGEVVAVRHDQIGELATLICPFLPSSLENQVTFSVHMRSAVSRSRQLARG